jgi:DNA-binding response OmpR family regulator
VTTSRLILVVDDDADIRTLTRTVLSSAGYDVRSASSGAEALRILHDAPFDLVLLDVNMPGMSGWETLRLLKAGDPGAGLPVVMFSVKGEVRDKVHAMQEGAVDYITKPFDVDELLIRVRRVLEPTPREA